MKGLWYTPSEHHSLKKAVCKGRIKRVREIISSRDRCYAQEWSDAADGYLLLCTAVEEKHTEIAKLLLTNGSKVNSGNGNPSETPLHFAVRNGNIEIVHMLLHKGANIDARNSSGSTPLRIAVVLKRMEIIGILLNHGASIEATNKDDITLLHIATNFNSEEIVNLLLTRGANVNAEQSDGTTSLHIAVERGYSRIVEQLLKHGAYVDACGNQEAYTPLHLAVKNGNKEMIKWLLNKGANVNAEAKDGTTSLRIALKNRHLKIAEQLLDCGANVNAVYSSETEDGYTELHFAVKNGSEKVMKLLLSKGADVNAAGRDGATPLHIALKKPHLGMAEQLLKCGANIDACKDDYTELHRAVINGSKKIMKWLLDKGANINAEGKDGITPLHIALNDKKFQIAEHLIKSGADVNAVFNSEYGYTPLHLAARNGKKEIVKLLLRKGANVNAQTKDDISPPDESVITCGDSINAVWTIDSDHGYTPLHFATKGNHLHVAELLIEYGAKPDSTIKHGVGSLLILAVRSYSREIAESILKLGASVNSTDDHGETALHKVCRMNNIEVITPLLEYGCDVTTRSKRNHTALDCAMAECKERYEFSLSPRGSLDDIHFLDDNDRNYVNLIKIVKRHMVKIRAANLYVVNKDELFRKDIFIPIPAFDNYNDKLSDFQNECEKEIESMKSEIINDKITFYDILAGSVRQVAMYATNENIAEVFGSDNYKIKFPIYANMININFRKGEREKEFMEKGDQIFSFLYDNKFPWLPRDCIEKILSYLNYEDLL